MRRALLVLVAIGLMLTVAYTIEASRYALGTPAQPGPGFYPFIVGAVLAVGCLGTGWEAARSRSDEKVAWAQGTARWRVLAIALASLGYVVLLPYLGHPLAGALVTLVVFQVMALPRWPVKIALAIVVGLGSYYLFAVLLGVPLPVGFGLD